jgi:hypothetical protein
VDSLSEYVMESEQVSARLGEKGDLDQVPSECPEQGCQEEVRQEEEANGDSYIADSFEDTHGDASGSGSGVLGDEDDNNHGNEGTIEDLLLPNGEAHILSHPCNMKIPAEWTSGVTSFCCERSAVNAVNSFQRSNYCSLGYQRTVKPNPEKNVRGRLNFACIHGINHHRKLIHPKPKIRFKQRVNFVGCQMRIFINQQKDGMWTLRSFEVEHMNAAGEPAHLTGMDVYKSSRKAKEIVDKQALELLKEFTAVNAPTTSIADRLSDKYGVNYTRKDITNRINNKLGALMSESDQLNVNTFLEEIIDGGGEVFAKYHDGSNKCRVLIIMTQYQKIDLNLSRPKVFINDTTFGTNSENFKVICHVL